MTVKRDYSGIIPALAKSTLQYILVTNAIEKEFINLFLQLATSKLFIKILHYKIRKVHR